MTPKVIIGIGLLVLLSQRLAGQENNVVFGNEGYYSSQAVEIENIYPNPASSVAILNYSVTDQSKDIKITLHDLLGTMTRDFPLNPYEKSLKIDLQDLKEGVYFYTLSMDGVSKVTKKLIVKK